MAIEKIKILGAVMELPAKQHCQFSPFGPFFEVNGADYSFDIKRGFSIAPAFSLHKDFDIASQCE